MKEAIIKFKIGDYVRCNYHHAEGLITSMKPQGDDNMYITFQSEELGEITTSLKMDSSQDLYPIYLQLICTKEDYEAIPARAMRQSKRINAKGINKK